MGSVKERPNLLDIFVSVFAHQVLISQRMGSIVLLSLGDWLRDLLNLDMSPLLTDWPHILCKSLPLV